MWGLPSRATISLNSFRQAGGRGQSKLLIKLWSKYLREFHAGRVMKGEWQQAYNSYLNSGAKQRGGGVPRLRNCQAIIDLIKAKRHRWLPYSAAVLHKVGRVKVTQEVGGRRCLPWQCTLALTRTNTNTLTEYIQSHMLAAKVKGCSKTQKGAAALVAQTALDIPRLLAVFSLKISPSIGAT